MAKSAGHETRAGLTVRDSIEMLSLSDPDIALSEFVAPEFKTSPDGEWLAYVTRSGSVETGLNEFSIDTLRVPQVLAFVNANDRRALPSVHRLLSMHTASKWAGIDRMSWTADGRALTFIGRNADAAGQVFRYDLQRRDAAQLTDHPRNIMRYALSSDGTRLVFAAQDYPDWSDRNARGYTVDSHYVNSLAWTDSSNMPSDIRYFVLDTQSGAVRQVNTPPSRYAEDIALSPTGRWAVIVSYDIVKIPQRWLSYKVVHDRLKDALHDGALAATGESADAAVVPSNDAFGSRSYWLARLLLADTDTGEVRQLMDAPVVAGGFFVRAIWSDDERKLILGPALLPLDGVAPEERAKREVQFAVAEVHVDTGQATAITYLAESDRLTGLDRIVPSVVQVRMANHDSPLTFRNRGTRWKQVAVHAPKRVQFSVQQDMNTPYNIVATDSRTARTKVVTDLNPQLRERAVGKVEPFQWSDRLGRNFEGGVVYPPDYDPARRYPVVIQTYGFSRRQFLVDGPFGITSAYAARPLASAGLLVLQMPDRDPQLRAARSAECTEWKDCGENPRFTAMLEGAIDALDKANLVDRSRIGLIGFSREGMHVFHALAFSQYPIRAATVADAVAPSPFAYALVYGYPYPGMLEFEARDMMGAPFWGKGIAQWEERSPIFHLDRITAAVRYEAYNRGVPAYWDAFAIMKRQQRPVEMIHIPMDIHRLQSPYGRLLSQQGNVDWFRFWLLDEEDNAPSKQDQYARWRRLKQFRTDVATGAAPSAPASSP